MNKEKLEEKKIRRKMQREMDRRRSAHLGMERLDVKKKERQEMLKRKKLK